MSLLWLPPWLLQKLTHLRHPAPLAPARHPDLHDLVHGVILAAAGRPGKQPSAWLEIRLTTAAASIMAVNSWLPASWLSTHASLVNDTWQTSTKPSGCGWAAGPNQTCLPAPHGLHTCQPRALPLHTTVDMAATAQLLALGSRQLHHSRAVVRLVQHQQ